MAAAVAAGGSTGALAQASGGQPPAGDGAAGQAAAAQSPAVAAGERLGADLARLLAVARDANPELAQMRLEASAAAERVEPAGALPDPRLRVELRDLTNFSTTSPSLSPARIGSTRYLLMQDVPWFGKRDLRRGVAQAEHDAARSRSEETLTAVAARVKTLFAQLYFVHANARLTRELLDLAAQLEAIVQSRYAGGLAPQQDVIRAQVERTNMRGELIVLEAERRQLSARMNALLGRPPLAELVEPETLPSLPDERALSVAALEPRLREGNPLLRTENARILAAERGRDLVLRNRYPDFTFGIAPTQYSTSVKEWELMVELNLPLRQDTRAAQERESQAMLDAASSRREAVATQLLGELAENLAMIESARHTGALIAGSLLPQAELTLRSALAGYENGRVDFAAVLDAQRQIRQARQSRLKAEVEARLRLAEVERLLGADL